MRAVRALQYEDPREVVQDQIVSGRFGVGQVKDGLDFVVVRVESVRLRQHLAGTLDLAAFEQCLAEEEEGEPVVVAVGCDFFQAGGHALVGDLAGSPLVQAPVEDCLKVLWVTFERSFPECLRRRNVAGLEGVEGTVVPDVGRDERRGIDRDGLFWQGRNLCLVLLSL